VIKILYDLGNLSNLKFKYNKFNSVTVAWNKMRLYGGKELEINSENVYKQKVEIQLRL